MRVDYAFKINGMNINPTSKMFVIWEGEEGNPLPFLPLSTPQELGESYAEYFLSHSQGKSYPEAYPLSYRPPFEVVPMGRMEVVKVQRLSRREIRQFETAVQKALSGK